MMTFSVKGDMSFEARSPDEALLKLIVYFMSQMEMQPHLQGEDENDAIPMVTVLSMPIQQETLNPHNITGGIGLDITGAGLLEAPAMMQ